MVVAAACASACAIAAVIAWSIYGSIAPQIRSTKNPIFVRIRCLIVPSSVDKSVVSVIPGVVILSAITVAVNCCAVREIP